MLIKNSKKSELYWTLKAESFLHFRNMKNDCILLFFIYSNKFYEYSENYFYIIIDTVWEII